MFVSPKEWERNIQADEFTYVSTLNANLSLNLGPLME